jgi:hypothetical protein
LDNTVGFWRRLLTASLLFVLLSEWMRPLSMMSDVTGIYMIVPLLFTLAAVMATDLLKLPLVLNWILKLLIILSLAAAAHSGTHLANMDWWRSFVQRLPQDANHILHMEWGLLNPELRTCLFLLSWAIIAACLFTAVFYKRFALWFTGGTAVYLMLLSWWPGLDTFPGMLRAVGAGLLLHAILVPISLLHMNGLRLNLARLPISWSLTTALFVTLTVGLGYIMAEQLGDSKPISAASAWDMLNPLRHLDVSGGVDKRAGGGKTGYGHDDSSLGGSLQSDDAPAFLAAVSHTNVYYRGEAKMRYDGKGWHGVNNELYRYGLDANLPNLQDSAVTASVKEIGEYWKRAPDLKEEGSEAIFLMDEEWLARLNANGLVDVEQWQVPRLKSSNGLSPIFAGSPVSKLEAIRTTAMEQMDEGFIALDRLEGNYWIGGTKEPLASYRIRTYGDQRSAEQRGSVSELSEDELAAALQLPEALPARLLELSAKIVSPYATHAQQAKAIESYLKQHYTYTLSPPIAKRSGSVDFVDRFLFEQMSGYCDYFSSAMVVLLRAAGIPARWVKGFAPGEELDPAEHKLVAERMSLSEPELLDNRNKHMILVRNSDAHSWVEAFLPGQGWVAFEPTPGFNGADAAASVGQSAVPAMAQLTSMEQQPPDRRIVLIKQAANWTVNQAQRWSKPYIGAIYSAMWGRERKDDLVKAGIASVVLCMMILLWQWLRTPSIRLRLGLLVYACGIGGARSDARLLERIVQDALHSKQEARLTGITFREALDSLPESIMIPMKKQSLAKAIHVYEQLCFGPPQTGRLPAKQLRSLWKETRG